jgi:hypothetical protein
LKKIITIFLIALASCVDPYIPVLENYNSLLVVDGLITNENISNRIKLYRTTTNENDTPEKVTDASVFITEADGTKTNLLNCGNGTYKTDSTSFTGIPGRKYTLHINTSDGKEYESEECQMISVAGIDTLYYEKAEEISGNNGQTFTGLKILINSSDATGLNQYFRWTFEETWKFNVPYPQQYTYGIVSDTMFDFQSIPVVQTVCWKSNNSGDIITNSIHSGGSAINNQEIQFIAPSETDRLTLQYSILVKQYSISKNESDFWNNLKKINDSGGDIFAAQPYSVVSNIHNINGTREAVLGYFEVSAVAEKRIFIEVNELVPLDLPDYKGDCHQISKSPSDWPDRQHPWDPPLRPSWDAIYHMYTDDGSNVFIRPEVSTGTTLPGHVSMNQLVKFVFSQTPCAICEYTGSAKKPDFWPED